MKNIYGKVVILVVLICGGNSAADFMGHWPPDEGLNTGAPDARGNCNDPCLDLPGPISITVWIRPELGESRHDAPLRKAASGSDEPPVLTALLKLARAVHEIKSIAPIHWPQGTVAFVEKKIVEYSLRKEESTNEDEASFLLGYCYMLQGSFVFGLNQEYDGVDHYSTDKKV